MTNSERRDYVLERMKQLKCEDISEVLNYLEAEIDAFESVPFGYRNEPTRIFEDLIDGKISQGESLERLVKFLKMIPD